MKKIMILALVVLCTISGIAQKQNFDMISYTSPKGWEKETVDYAVNYRSINNSKKTWCQITVYKSTASKGSIEKDFESEWEGIVVKNYQPTEAPQSKELQETGGWKIKSGSAKFFFNNSNGVAMLKTATGYNRCVSIAAASNSQDYLKDVEALLASVDFMKPEMNAIEMPVVNNDENSIIGVWVMSSGNNSNYQVGNGINGYIKRQYVFNRNGNYDFYIKSFSPVSNQLLLTQEKGTYQINGNTIIISPQKSIIESWSKKDGVDKWGKLLSTQNKILEKATYQFTKYYFSGIQVWNLVLQADKVTERDGPFSTNTTFTNAWYYSPVTSNNLIIELPAGEY